MTGLWLYIKFDQSVDLFGHSQSALHFLCQNLELELLLARKVLFHLIRALCPLLQLAVIFQLSSIWYTNIPCEARKCSHEAIHHIVLSMEFICYCRYVSWLHIYIFRCVLSEFSRTKGFKQIIQPEGLLTTPFQGPRMGGIYAKYWVSISI
jgi:hypothetical protein